MTKQFDLPAFIEWVREKPAGETYNAGNDDLCALAQFGLPGVQVDNLAKFGIPAKVYLAIFLKPTFGALLSRLERIEVGK